MKLRILALAALILPACTAPTTEESSVVATATSSVPAALDTIASAIRKAENAAMTPAQFNAFLDTYVSILPAAAPYLADAKLAYSALHAGGNLTIAALEGLAARYDSK